MPQEDSVTVLLQLVWRMFKHDPPSNYQEFKNRTSEVTIDLFLNHMHRSGPSAMCGPGNVSAFTCKADHSKLEAAGPGTRMLRCNIETTLLFPYATSVLLEELKLENEVLSDQWKTMLAAVAPERPERPFVLTLDQAKAKNDAKNAAQASEPQLGILADQLN